MKTKKFLELIQPLLNLNKNQKKKEKVEKE